MENLVTKLHEQIILAIKRTLVPQKVGIAFSGGVDSSLLAKVCSDLGFEITLLTIGFEHSHDIDFSRKIAADLGLRHITLVISEKSFPETAKEIRAQIGTDNLSWNENCIAFRYVSQLAQENGIENVLTSNGIDELFCGYNAYRDVVEDGKEAVLNLMDSKIDNEVRMMRAVNQVASNFGVAILQPLLSEEFIKFAKPLPLEMKIKDKNDLMRKHIIRELALSVGVPPESALKKKKALQYGSLIHKNLMKLRKT
ncbi:MAG TPA: asparagine synthase C-terminal domain-containing protein [Candidatus Nitrosotalea sp.]|nr:asparagine synthase C-terminal domain-containing protein [Candidatus Nitrosotalea sp.]